MDEEQTQAVNEEFAAPATEDMTQATEPTEALEEQEAPESDADRNFKALREERERDRQAREEAERRAMQIEAENKAIKEMLAAQQQPQQTQQQASDYDPDDWATYGEVDKVKAELAALKQENFRNRIYRDMPDFDKVVNQENLKKFEAAEPEIAGALNEVQDPYKAGVAAYKYLKQFLPQETPQQKQAKQRVADNAKRPGSLASVGGGTPLAESARFEQGLTKELKDQLWREVVEFSKG